MPSYFGGVFAAAKSALFGNDPKETGTPEGCDVVVAWDCKSISRIVHCMRFGIGRLPPLSIRDRQYHFRTYTKVFTGTEAVTYLLTCEQGGLVQLPPDLPRRIAASRFLHSLLLRKVFHHVTYEHGFQDADFFYRFEEDEGNAELNRCLCVAGPCPMSALDLSLYLLETMASAVLSTPLPDVSSPLNLAVLCEHNCLAFKYSLSYYQLVWQTSLLASTIGLESLDEDDKMCFWLNVHNLMCIHACVDTFALTNARKASVADGMEVGLAGAFYERVQYRIQGELYSLADIEHRCLRNMGPKSAFRRGLGKPRFSKTDPRAPFACKQWDHRINFAIVNGTKCSGRVFFYRRGCLKPILEECTRDFVRLHVRLVQLSEARTPRAVPRFQVWLPRLLEEFGSFESTWPQLVRYLPLAVRVEVSVSHLLTTNFPSSKFISNSPSFHIDLRQLGGGKHTIKPSEYCPVRCNTDFEDDDREGFSVEQAAASVQTLGELRMAFTDAEQESELRLVTREYLEYFRAEWGNAPCTTPSHPGLPALAEIFSSLYAAIAAPLSRTTNETGCTERRQSGVDFLSDDEPISRDTETDVLEMLEEMVLAPLFPELLDWYYRKYDSADAKLVSVKQRTSAQISLTSLGLRPELCISTPGCYSKAIEALDDMAGYLILSSSSVLANFPSMRLVDDCTPTRLVSSLGKVVKGITDSVQEYYEGKSSPPQSLSADDLVLIMSYAVTQTVPQLEGLVGFTTCLTDLLQSLDSSGVPLERCESAFFLHPKERRYSFSAPPLPKARSFSTLSSHHFLHAGSSSLASASSPGSCSSASSLSALSMHLAASSSSASSSSSVASSLPSLFSPTVSSSADNLPTSSGFPSSSLASSSPSDSFQVAASSSLPAAPESSPLSSSLNSSTSALASSAVSCRSDVCCSSSSSDPFVCAASCDLATSPDLCSPPPSSSPSSYWLSASIFFPCAETVDEDFFPSNTAASSSSSSSSTATATTASMSLLPNVSTDASTSTISSSLTDSASCSAFLSSSSSSSSASTSDSSTPASSSSSASPRPRVKTSLASSCSSSICSIGYSAAPFDLNFEHDTEPTEGKADANAPLLQSRCSSHGCQQYYQSLVAGQDGFCLATLTCALRFVLDSGK